MLNRPLSLLAASLVLFGCGGRVIIDQGVGGSPGNAGAGGQTAATTSTGTTTPCSGIQNDCCATAIDATMGGSFEGTTCGADATFQTTGQCGPIGAPDAFYFVNQQTFFTYQIDVSPGFYIMVTAYPETCDAPSGCPFEGSSGLMYGDGPRYVAVQRQDGQCGPFKISFQPQK